MSRERAETPARVAGLLALLAALALAAGQEVAASPVAPADRAAKPAPDPGFIETCQACHGADGMMVGTRAVPRLLGQRSVYLVAALRAYRDGSRADATMRAMAAGLADDQIDLAAKVMSGEQSPQPRPARPAPSGPRSGPPAPLIVQGVCAGCHGQTGIGVVPEYPRLGGQRLEYMQGALADYRSGARSNPTMRTIAGALTPAQIDEVSAYYAAHDGGVYPSTPGAAK